MRHPNPTGLRSALVVLIVEAEPGARLVASFGRAIEPLKHAPEPVESARIGGVRMVGAVVIERERAHAWRFARGRVSRWT